MLLGLAFEEMLMKLADDRNISEDLSASKRMVAIRKKIESDAKGDSKDAALSALNITDIMRCRRILLQEDPSEVTCAMNEEA